MGSVRTQFLSAFSRRDPTRQLVPRQRVPRAARFTSGDLNADETDGDSQASDSPTDELALNVRQFTGTQGQCQIVEACFRDHAMGFVVPWIDEMIPCHWEILRRIVFQLDCSRGKGAKHILPQESFLDRHSVNSGSLKLYAMEEPETTDTLRRSIERTGEARYSPVDCTTYQLQVLLEMILSFHAAYKYGSSSEKTNFDPNVRLMMRKIKMQIHRGRETKNWSISKFHELLHMVTDSENFGSHANIDAGKGEHGLKRWAKRPSKTVRSRDANNYYRDLATRVYEDRIIEVATATLMPHGERTKGMSIRVTRGDPHTTIVLSNMLASLDVIGTSLFQADLTDYLRTRPNLVFPLQIYQEATYSTNGVHQATIRGTPKYRNTGPWHDCVLVNYEDDTGDKKEYPYQVHCFFTELGKQTKLAVGRMGMMKKTSSKLLDEWTYKKSYRIVDLETISRLCFALSIPRACYNVDGDNMPYRMYVMKDRIGEWPGIFNDGDWEEPRMSSGSNKRKRTRRK